ncbi:unnamed protein product [Rodentolepis nana]|uniref:Cep57_CLD domain-containing protein n=1 Tax=Rodentolepis nana TaxID=102285 RepID=A0A0R3T7P7_RODNA|nr:unnamed protein product [Rodentolepis nana]
MCSDAISCSPTHYYSDEEPNEVARLQTEVSYYHLGKLIEDELCRSPLDPSLTIDYSNSSHDLSPALYPNNDLHERDEVDFQDQFPEPLPLHLQNSSYSQFHYSEHANGYGIENPNYHKQLGSQHFQDINGSVCGSYTALCDGLTSPRNRLSTLSKHTTFSTPNLSSRIVEGISNELDPSYDRESTISPAYDGSKLIGHLFIPQPDDSASPVRLSPIPITTSKARKNEPISNPLEENVDTLDRNREYLIFEARGRQLQEAQQEISLLKEELAQSERLNNHKDILAKAQIESLNRQLEEIKKANIDSEKRNKELSEEVSVLNNQLSALKKLKEDSDNKLADLEAKNASLSSELIQLSNGFSLNLAKQRENNLTECLNRRHAMAEEVLQENLEISQRKIANKENELMSLRKDLESERLRCSEMTAKHNELVDSLQNKLKASQERCSELSSSSLCIEVGELRERIKEVLTSKKITDDINEILQEELRDVREQLAIYEQSLDIFSVVEERELTPRHQLPLFHDTKGGQISTILSKTSPIRNRRRSCQSVTFAGCQNDSDGKEDVLTLKRPSSAADVPLSSTWNQEIGDRASASTPHRIFTASTDQTKVSLPPQINESIGALKTELKNTLVKYKAKREQTTSLYEKLFSARCDLHKAVAERDRAESARADLQVRQRLNITSFSHQLMNFLTLRFLLNSKPRFVPKSLVFS